MKTSIRSFAAMLLGLGAAVATACSNADPIVRADEADASAPPPPVDAGVPDSSPELTEPRDPYPCPTPEETFDIPPEPFSLVFETPENIELRAAGVELLLAYDHAAKQFIVYYAGESDMTEDVQRTEIREHTRLDTKYDRAELHAGSGLVLACAGATCDLVDAYSSSGKSIRVPDEIAPRAFSRECVAGRGIACLDEYTRQWTFPAAGAKLEKPIELLYRLGPVEFLVVDTSGATWLVRGDQTEPFDTGAGEPLVAVTAAGLYTDWQQWIGRTASGKLVVGSLKSAHTCPGVHADAIGWGFHREKDTVRLRYEVGTWSAHEVPADLPGVGFNMCGLALATFAFDSHRVFSTPIVCAFD